MDIRIASENAMFGLGEVKWGVIPAGGSHIRLPQQIPWAVAMGTAADRSHHRRQARAMTSA